MNLRFFAQTRSDLLWFRRYYTMNFPDGDDGAKRSYQATKRLLKEHPLSGEALDNSGLRAIRIARTPFSFIYRVEKHEIQILRLWDGRRDRPNNWEDR